MIQRTPPHPQKAPLSPLQLNEAANNTNHLRRRLNGDIHGASRYILQDKRVGTVYVITVINQLTQPHEDGAMDE
jgi:hypothetical protein